MVGCATASSIDTSGLLWCQCPQSFLPGLESKPNQTTINHIDATMSKGSQVGSWGRGGSFALSCSDPLLVCHNHSTINLSLRFLLKIKQGRLPLLDLEVFKPFHPRSSFNSNSLSTSGLLPILISQQSCSHTALASQLLGS